MKKVITTVVEREIEEEFKEIAFKTFGKKGYYSKAIQEAMLDWTRKKKEKDVITKAMMFLETGLKGKKWKFKREEIHER
jgi:hypothetical protein